MEARRDEEDETEDEMEKTKTRAGQQIKQAT